jgi:hypothetical protein
VPNSPETTAAQIAGPQALAEATALAAAMQNAPPANPGDAGAAGTGNEQPGQGSPSPTSPQAGQGQTPKQGQGPGQPEGQGQGEGEGKGDHAGQGKSQKSKIGAASAAGSGGTAKSGGPSDNPDTPPGEAQVKAGPQPGDSRTDTDLAHQAEADAKKFKEEPWVAKLPPELRKAMRAKSQRRAPRGYEERLQRYFENVD